MSLLKSTYVLFSDSILSSYPSFNAATYGSSSHQYSVGILPRPNQLPSNATSYLLRAAARFCDRHTTRQGQIQSLNRPCALTDVSLHFQARRSATESAKV